MTLTVDVISDVICPWCYIGKRRLEAAIASRREQTEVLVRWHPFLLNPNMPQAGINRRDYRTTKFGSWERSLELDAQVTAAGRTEGIPFAFDKIERTPNTIDAHRLIWLAGEKGVQDAVVEALFRAYFTEGRDISNRQTLLDVVAGAGLDRSRAVELLTGDGGLQAVRSGEKKARQIGVSGVPFFLVNEQPAFSGAREPAAFLAAFDCASEVSPPTSEGGVCGVGVRGSPSC
jgi:predicted DsbA family dithiol-disulfide isomerase